MKNLNAIIILATVAGMATLTACSSAKAEQVTDTNETAVPAETTTAATPRAKVKKRSTESKTKSSVKETRSIQSGGGA